MEVALRAEARAGTGKGVTRKLRAQGKVPGVVYGLGGDAVAVAVEARSLSSALHTGAGRNVLIGLELDGNTHLTLLREIQRDPVRGSVVHVDFLRVSHDQTISVEVPIHIEGDAPGVKEGGVIEHHLWNVEVQCTPTSVPDRIIADVSSMGIASALHVRELTVPEGARILTEPDEIVLTIVVPQKVEELVPAAEEAVAEGAEAGEGAEAATKAEE